MASPAAASAIFILLHGATSATVMVTHSSEIVLMAGRTVRRILRVGIHEWCGDDAAMACITG